MRIAVGAAAVLAATVAAAVPVEVEVRGLRLDPDTGTPVVRLVEKASGGRPARELPIWIGPFEAQAIAIELQGLPTARPLTHDLMKQLVERLGAKLTRVVIEDLRDDTYFATLHLDAPGGAGFTVDARPSDAIALALRFGGPILVAEEVFVKAAASQATLAAVHLWGLTLQDLTPEIAKLFAMPDTKGALVSDVAPAAPAKVLARGDVITDLDGVPVGSARELAARAGARAAAEPVRLSVQRAGQRLVLRFTSR